MKSEIDILGENLTQIRAHLHLTQKDVSHELGISTHQIVGVETGSGACRVDAAIAICNLYGISLRSALKEDFWKTYYEKVPKKGIGYYGK